MLLSSVTNGDVRGGLADSEAAIFMKFGPNDLSCVSDTTGSTYKTKNHYCLITCKLDSNISERQAYTYRLFKKNQTKSIFHVESNSIREASESIFIEDTFIGRKNLDIIVPNIFS